MKNMMIKKNRNLKLICAVCVLSFGLIGSETIRMYADNEEEQTISNENLIVLKHVDTEKNDHYRVLDEFINQLSQEEIDKAEAAERERLRKIEEERLAKIAKQKEIENKTVRASRYVSTSEISANTDLSVMREVNADQINKIINYWAKVNGGSTFIGLGQVFIDASKQTGLDPVYILAHAGLESAWGTSAIAVNKHNYFGIGAVDTNPYGGAHVQGDSVSEGIMTGATWIAKNYYNKGQTSLYSMRYNNGVHEYCTSTTWPYSIATIIQTSYSLID